MPRGLIGWVHATTTAIWSPATGIIDFSWDRHPISISSVHSWDIEHAQPFQAFPSGPATAFGTVCGAWSCSYASGRLSHGAFIIPTARLLEHNKSDEILPTGHSGRQLVVPHTNRGISTATKSENESHTESVQSFSTMHDIWPTVSPRLLHLGADSLAVGASQPRP